jgi:CDGSH iron-sulfur domain-containing protein 3
MSSIFGAWVMPLPSVHDQHPNLGFQESRKPMWALCAGVPIECRSPQKGHPFCMPIHTPLLRIGTANKKRQRQKLCTGRTCDCCAISNKWFHFVPAAGSSNDAETIQSTAEKLERQRGNLPRKTIMSEMAEIGGRQPIRIKAEKGKSYWWCACGLSKTQPFCDGSHKVTKFTPIEFKPSTSAEVRFCACKRSSRKPLCDGSHQSL